MIEKIAVDPVSGREEWLALRKRDVTASAAAALFGVHPFMSGFTLWQSKTGGVDDEDTPPMRRGRLLEPVAVELLREERPEWLVERGAHYWRDPEARLGATPDVLAECRERGPGIVQIKSVEPGVFRRRWRGEDGAIEVPLYVAVQAVIEAHLTGAQWCAVAALVVSHGVDLHVLDVPLHPGLIMAIEKRIADFWQIVDSGEMPPFDYAKDGAAIAALFAHENGQTVDLSGDNRLRELFEERERLAADKKQAEARIDEINAEARAKLGEATFGTLPGWTVSAKTVERRAYTVAASSYRRLVIKRA